MIIDMYLFQNNFWAEPEICHIPYLMGGLYSRGLKLGEKFLLVSRGLIPGRPIL